MSLKINLLTSFFEWRYYFNEKNVYKILVNGLNPVGTYTLDGFTMKEGTFEEKMFDMKYNKDNTGVNLNMNLYLISCLNDYKKLTYNYFESNEFIEIEVSNKTTKYNLNKVLDKNKEITHKVTDLEKKIRIIFNMLILFQSISIEFYDENKKYVSTYQLNKPISNWNRLTYNLSTNEIYNNSRFGMDFNAMKNTNNNYFNRAIEFYNDSFDSEKITNRYILIFSSLEAIFNLDTEDVTEKISRYSAKLLAEENEEEYQQIYSDIKRLYKKRCDYIHGSKTNNILDEDEKLLRFYVRKIILAYWILILYTKKTAKQILEYLNSDEKLDLQVRLFISSLKSRNFSEQQHRIVDIVEKEFGKELPQETKQSLYSKCNDDEK